MMTKTEKLQTIREMLGNEANLLDAAYVLEALEAHGLGVEDAQNMTEDEFLDYVDEGIRNGTDDIREILSRHGAIPASVEKVFEDGMLKEVLDEWLGIWDHVAAYGTSETCLADTHSEALDDLERSVTHRHPREAVEEFVSWWSRAYDVYLKAREQDKLGDVCELLITGNLERARGLVQG